jgi:hypothetical protein
MEDRNVISRGLVELQDSPHIQLTSKHEWNPHKVQMNEVMVSSVSANRPNDADEDLLKSIDPALSGLKENLAVLVPRYVAEVATYNDALENTPTRQTYTSTERHTKMSAEVLADRFGIGLERARQTLKETTQ